MTRLILALFFFIATGVSAASTTNNCPNCIQWQAETAHLAGGESLVLTENEDIIFLYRASYRDIDSVWMCCGIQGYLTLLDSESQVWGMRYPVPRLDEAIIGYSFSEQKQHETLFFADYKVWRGANAPSAPAYAHPLRGYLSESRFMGIALNEVRGIMTYFPPDYDESQSYPVIYSADGQSVVWYAPYLEALIVAGEIPATLMIGTYSSDFRAEEYLPNLNRERFAYHERFFTEEVRHWAENHLGASRRREERAVFGFSNGGVFAAAMALAHPELYGIAFPFSAGMNIFEAYPDTEIEPEQKLYFAAGSLEEDFLQNTRSLSERFAEGGANVVFRERVAGHDFYMWQEEFYYAVKWAFGS
jgi:enterochelin esterase-like enzyme